MKFNPLTPWHTKRYTKARPPVGLVWRGAWEYSKTEISLSLNEREKAHSAKRDTAMVPAEAVQRILDGILQELDMFRGGHEGMDDVTAVVIRCTEGTKSK